MDMLMLKEELFIGKGRHKKTYVHPEDSNLCVKFGYSDEGVIDLEREVAYRALRDKQGLKTSLLPMYIGGVKTNFGKGHTFERIVDFDGHTSASLEDYLENEKVFDENYDLLLKLVCEFKKSFFADRLITMDLFPENILIRKNSAQDWSGFLINDMGSSAAIPLEYYIDYFRKAKIQRKWDRFAKHIKEKYTYKRIADFYDKIK